MSSGRPGHEARLELARRVGADEAVVFDRAAATAYAAELTGGVGMGLVIESAGTSEALQTALDMTAPYGTLATLGLVRTTEIVGTTKMLRGGVIRDLWKRTRAL